MKPYLKYVLDAIVIAIGLFFFHATTQPVADFIVHINDRQGFQQPTSMKPYLKYMLYASVIVIGLFFFPVTIQLVADFIAHINDTVYEIPTSFEKTFSVLAVLEGIITFLIYRFSPGSEKNESDQSE